MRRVITTLGVLGVLSVSAAPAAFAASENVCQPLSSGKFDTTGNPSTVTLTAPEGSVITGYCVKAGSAKQGDGPVYVELDHSQWASSITIGHPSGKAVSHYSFSIGTLTEGPAPAPGPDPDPDPVPDPDPIEPDPGPVVPGPGPVEPVPGPAPDESGQPARGVIVESPASGAVEQRQESSAEGASARPATEVRAVNNRGLNVDGAAQGDAVGVPLPAVVGGMAALLAAGGWAVRRRFTAQ